MPNLNTSGLSGKRLPSDTAKSGDYKVNPIKVLGDHDTQNPLNESGATKSTIDPKETN